MAFEMGINATYFFFQRRMVELYLKILQLTLCFTVIG